MKYVATFGSGWMRVIKKILNEKFVEIEILNLYDGLVVFKSNNIIEIKKMSFFNNIYLMLASYNYKNNNFDNNVNCLLNSLNLNYEQIKKNICDKYYKTFKIIGLNENQPCTLNYKNIAYLEKNICKNLNITVGQRKHDLDFIFLQRSENYIYFLLKLSYNRTTEKNLAHGSLRPELSYLLASYANIQEKDIVIDPFCGSGSIPKEIVKNFKYNMCFASDIDESKMIAFKQEYKKNNKKLFIKQLDALNLDKFENNFIDVIITDPPWNIYEKDNTIDFEIFYINMLKEFSRILKNDGRIVILMGNILTFEAALNHNKILKKVDCISLLVNGKKANAYLLKK